MAILPPFHRANLLVPTHFYVLLSCLVSGQLRRTLYYLNEKVLPTRHTSPWCWSIRYLDFRPLDYRREEHDISNFQCPPLNAFAGRDKNFGNTETLTLSHFPAKEGTLGRHPPTSSRQHGGIQFGNALCNALYLVCILHVVFHIITHSTAQQ